jgi:hypothetical protein
LGCRRRSRLGRCRRLDIHIDVIGAPADIIVGVEEDEHAGEHDKAADDEIEGIIAATITARWRWDVRFVAHPSLRSSMDAHQKPARRRSAGTHA